MSLEQWSYLAQIIGAIAVVASLVFVGVQLRQNTKAILTQTSQTHSALYHSIIAGLSENGEVARIWRVGLLDFQSLSPDDRVRFLAFVSTLFRYYEASHVQSQRGLLDADHWRTIEQQVTDLACQPGVKAWWQLRRHWHSRAFQDWFEARPQRDAGVLYDKPQEPAPGGGQLDKSQERL
jgi:hypothetical protein